MAQTKARINTLQSVQNVLNSRKRITETQAAQGVFVQMTVRGNGNIIDVRNSEGDLVPAADGSGEILRKKIFNLVCNSDVAIKNERNKDLLRSGYKAEQSGDTEQAAVHYNDYLNKTQVSISVLSTSANFTKIQNGDQVKGRVQLITTDKGSILTLDPSTLSIMAPSAGEDTSLNLMDMMIVEEGTTNPVVEEVITANA